VPFESRTVMFTVRTGSASGGRPWSTTPGFAGSTVNELLLVVLGTGMRPGSEEASVYGGRPPTSWKVKGTPPYAEPVAGSSCNAPPVEVWAAPPPPQLERRTAVMKPRTIAAQVLRSD
jgi:hypothetical protein